MVMEMGSQYYIRKLIILLVWLLSLTCSQGCSLNTVCKFDVDGGSFTKVIMDLVEGYKNGSSVEKIPITVCDMGSGVSASDIAFSYQPTDFRINWISSNSSIDLIVNSEELDAESPPGDFTLQCYKKNQSSVTNKLTIKVFLKDKNEIPPVFSKANYATNVTEDTLPEPNTVILDGIQAIDGDDLHTPIDYKILNNSEYHDYFKIQDSNQGSQILLEKKLDYENITSPDKIIVLTVMATDTPSNDVHLNSTVEVHVRVLDVDDLNPNFNSSSYDGTILENAHDGTEVTLPKIIAEDQDSFKEKLLYSLIPNEFGSQYFKIKDSRDKWPVILLNQQTSEIERGKQFFLQIKAAQINDETRFAIAIMRISVTAANVNIPSFTQLNYEARVPENIPNGTQLLTVTAIDKDEVKFSTSSNEKLDSNLTYKFEGPVTKFLINGKSGVITTNDLLDYETAHQHNLSVLVSDGNFSANTLVTINLLDVNDNNPVPEKALYSHKASRVKGDVLTIKVTDKDKGSILKYSVTSVNSNLFTINKNGIIAISGEPSQILQEEYILPVKICDNGVPHRCSSTTVKLFFEPLVTSDNSPKVSAQVQDLKEFDKATYGLAAGVGLLLIVIIILVIYIKKRIEKHSNNSNATVKPLGEVPPTKTPQSLDPEGLIYRSNTSTNSDDSASNGSYSNPLAVTNEAYLNESEEDENGSPRNAENSETCEVTLPLESAIHPYDDDVKPVQNGGFSTFGKSSGTIDKSTANAVQNNTNKTSKDKDKKPKKITWGKTTTEDEGDVEFALDTDVSVEPADSSQDPSAPNDSSSPETIMYF